MPRMPGAEWLGEHSPQTPMTRYDGVCVHTIVGWAPAHAAHFSVKLDGKILQSRDTKFRSAGNLDGNHRIIVIENEDGGKDIPLTTAQVESNARILAWAHRTHGVPLQLCPDSKSTSRGLMVHRQGIDGNFTLPAQTLGLPRSMWLGRVSGGEHWSTSTGKICPRDNKIAQVPAILARAKEIVNPKTSLVLATANLNFGRSVERQQAILDGIGADVVFTQEDVRGGGRERVILRGAARRKVELLSSGKVLAARNLHGMKIRRRHFAYKDVEIPNVGEVRLVCAHIAPRRMPVLRPIYHARLRALIRGRWFIVGGDWNERRAEDPADLKARRKARWYGKRIDSFAVHPSLVKYVKRSRHSEDRRDGHPTVYLEMEF